MTLITMRPQSNNQLRTMCDLGFYFMSLESIIGLGINQICSKRRIGSSNSAQSQDDENINRQVNGTKNSGKIVSGRRPISTVVLLRPCMVSLRTKHTPA